MLFSPEFTSSLDSPGHNVSQESKEKAFWLFPYLWETARSGLRSQRGRSELLGKAEVSVLSLWGTLWPPCSHHKAWACGASICNSASTYNSLLVRKLSGWQFVATHAAWLAQGLHVTVTDSLQAGATATQVWHLSSRVGTECMQVLLHLSSKVLLLLPLHHGHYARAKWDQENV